MDLFVTNDKVYNSLFHNLGGNRFEEVAFDAGVAANENGDFISGMGVDFRDIDNDGLPDIVFVALDDETFPLFRNTGKGAFLDATWISRMGPLSLRMAGYSPSIFDFDNDGWKDVFVTRGHVQSPGAAPRVVVDQPNTVFRNLGGTTFQALTEEAGLTSQPPRRHRGSAVADLNGDGRLDVVVSALAAPAEIWINQSPGANHWLELKLEGTRSNRDAIGGRVKVVAGRTTQYNHVTTAVGYASSSAGPLHFGLGPEGAASLVVITWPSGTVQELRNVAGDRIVKVREPRE
jgi:enediyne biosynthesis protein E4